MVWRRDWDIVVGLDDIYIMHFTFLAVFQIYSSSKSSPISSSLFVLFSLPLLNASSFHQSPACPCCNARSTLHSNTLDVSPLRLLFTPQQDDSDVSRKAKDATNVSRSHMIRHVLLLGQSLFCAGRHQ